MKKIKLNKDIKQLNPKIKYIINMKNEINEVQEQMLAIHPKNLYLLDDYHTWLKESGFNENYPSPTNEYVKHYYGTKALWDSKFSQGIVVKEDDDDGDFYIVMQCKEKISGYNGTQIILTIGGCL